MQDVVDVLQGEDLHDVVLVGHTYGGMVISGVAELAAGRLSHLIFLDAFVLEDGQSLFDLPGPERRDLYLRAAEEHGEGWQVPPPRPQVWGITDEVQVARLAGRLTPQPLRTFEQPVRLRDTAASALPRTYVHRTAGPLVPSFAPFAARARSDTGWRYRELATGHDAMLTAPEDLAELLLEPRRN